MDISKQETGIATVLNLSGRADLRDIAGLRATLLESLERRHPAVVDFTALESSDLVVLQVVAAAAASFDELALPLVLRDRLDGAFTRSCNLAGWADLASRIQE